MPGSLFEAEIFLKVSVKKSPQDEGHSTPESNAPFRQMDLDVRHKRGGCLESQSFDSVDRQLFFSGSADVNLAIPVGSGAKEDG